METRPELLMLQKTMVVVEGVSRTLDPHFNMWEAAEPVVGDWIRKISWSAGHGADAKESAYALLHFTRQDAGIVAAHRSHLGRSGHYGGQWIAPDDATAEAIGRAVQAQHSRSGPHRAGGDCGFMAAIAIKLYI